MNNQQDSLEQNFELASDEAAVEKHSPAQTPDSADARSATSLTHSLALLKRIPVTLTLEVASVQIMLAELLNIDDDSVIELDKMAGEPLDIKVNNILLGKAEVVVVNERYGLRVLEFNTQDINELAQ